MKITTTSHKQRAGFTLLELTLTISILLSLIGITFAASQAYVNGSREAGCLIVQDKIHKVIVSHANMMNKRFRPGVDYCAEPDFKAQLGRDTVCPKGGNYSAVLDADGKTLIITCLEHGHSHE